MSDKAWIQELRKDAEAVTSNAAAWPEEYAWPIGEQLAVSPYYSVRRFVAAASPDRILELIGMGEEPERGADKAVGCLEVKEQLNETLRQREQELVRDREEQANEIERLKRVEEFVECTGRARAVMDRAEAAEAKVKALEA